MKLYKSLFLIIILSSFGYTGSIFLDEILSKLKKYETEGSPEKTFIHTDKPYYTTGETIWLKSYLVNGVHHTSFKKSKVLYIELINPNDSIVFKEKLFVSKSDFGAAGSIPIKEKWNSGSYQLRAYTNYMRNADVDYFFKKNIVIEKLKKPTKSNSYIDSNNIPIVYTPVNTEESNHNLIKDPKDLILKFYPEGGTIVANKQNTFGIKAQDKNGNGVMVKGVIREKGTNSTSFPFRTFNFGLGNITFSPKANTIYVANVIVNDKTVSYELPIASKQSVNIQVKNRMDTITLTVNANKVNINNYFIIGHVRGKAFYSKKIINPSNNKYSIQLITKDIETGVAHFTLFNSQGKPESERLTFIDSEINKLKTKITLQKKEVQKREKVNLSINAFIKNTEIQNANVSVAVTQKNLVSLSNRETIKSWLLLNSDLRGEIPYAMFFFNENKPKRFRKFLLESLMLTHGWRRFNWKNTSNINLVKNKKYKPEKGIYIKGKAIAIKDKVQPESIATSLVFMGNEMYNEKKDTDAEGRFSYGPYTIYDTIGTIIQARIPVIKNEQQKRKVSILLDPEQPSPTINKIPVLKKTEEVYTSFKNYIKKQEYIKQVNFSFDKVNKLEEIIVVEKGKTENDIFQERADELCDYGIPTKRFVVDSLTGLVSTSAFDVLVNTIISRRDRNIQRVYLDGIEILTKEHLQSIPGYTISFIDLLQGADVGVYGGTRTAGGVAMMYSNQNNNFKITKKKPGIIDFLTTPFYKAKEFYAPDYSDDFNELYKPDYRTTLYWNPTINIGARKEQKENFYASDQPGTYQIEVQGITNEGKLIYAVEEFEIVE